MKAGDKEKFTPRYHPAANLISLFISAALVPTVFAPACYVLALNASRAILPWYFWYEKYYVAAEFLIQHYQIILIIAKLAECLLH